MMSIIIGSSFSQQFSAAETISPRLVKYASVPELVTAD